MTAALKEAERIARALANELQAIPQDQVLEHYNKRISEIPEEFRPLVDSTVSVGLIYGHKTNNNGLKSSTAPKAQNGHWDWRTFLKTRYVPIFVVVLIGAIVTVALFHSSNQASDFGKSELRKLRIDDRNNLIIFVHGIRDDGNLTWTNDETGANWPEMLKEDIRFSNFDLASFHYSSLLFENGNLSISNVSDLLFFRLDHNFINNYEKIVFVAHSMGGIVVRNLLIKYDAISEKVPLVYFLATPTAGADIAKLAQVLGLKNRQLQALTSFEKSAFLQDQTSTWRTSRLSSEVYSLCAFETRATFGIMVVDQASAQSLCTGQTIPSGQTHSGIAKPYSRESIIYKVFADHITALLSTISE